MLSTLSMLLFEFCFSQCLTISLDGDLTLGGVLLEMRLGVFRFRLFIGPEFAVGVIVTQSLVLGLALLGCVAAACFREWECFSGSISANEQS